MTRKSTCRSTEAEWGAYFAHTLGSACGDATKTHAVLEFGIDWSECIHAGRLRR